MDKQAVVIDNGTGYTKMGYAGNLDPDFVIPTAIADLDKKSTLSVSTKNDEYNYYIGEEAINKAKESKNHKLTYPMQNLFEELVLEHVLIFDISLLFLVLFRFENFGV